MVGGMRKEDMIRLHALLFQMRTTFEEKGLAKSEDFGAYDRLGVTPVSLHRDRRTHQMAIFLLGESLSKAAVLGSDHLKHQLHFINQPRIERI